MIKKIITHYEFIFIVFSNNADNDNMLHMITGISYAAYYMLTGSTIE